MVMKEDFLGDHPAFAHLDMAVQEPGGENVRPWGDAPAAPAQQQESQRHGADARIRDRAEDLVAQQPEEPSH